MHWLVSACCCCVCSPSSMQSPERADASSVSDDQLSHLRFLFGVTFEKALGNQCPQSTPSTHRKQHTRTRARTHTTTRNIREKGACTCKTTTRRNLRRRACECHCIRAKPARVLQGEKTTSNAAERTQRKCVQVTGNASFPYLCFPDFCSCPG